MTVSMVVALLRQKYLFPFFLIVFGSFIYFPYLQKPFVGHHDWNSVVYANSARNYVRYGLLTTKFGQVRNPDVASPQDFGFTTHYPPLLSLLIGGSFYVFGINEVSARLIPAVSMIVASLAVYGIGAKIVNSKVGEFAGLFFLLTPIIRYFGLIPVHETVVPMWSLLSLLFYVFWYSEQKKWQLSGLFITLILGGLTNWSAYYIVPPLTLHLLIFSHHRHKKKLVLALWLTCIILFALHIIHITILTGALPREFIQKFAERSSPSLTANLYGYSFGKYMIQEFRYFKIYHSSILLILSVFWFVLMCISRKRDWKTGVIFILILYGLPQLILFRQLSFIHDYMIIYMTPFIVLSSAVVYQKLTAHLGWVKQLFMITLLLACLFIETQPFLMALYKSNANRRGFKVGVLINQNTAPKEKSLITSHSYKEFQDVFINFYADRTVEFQETLPQDLQEYRLIVVPKDHAALDPIEKEKLNSWFIPHENQQFDWYDTSQSRSPTFAF